jgi:hypothetical protein
MIYKSFFLPLQHIYIQVTENKAYKNTTFFKTSKATKPFLLYQTKKAN